MCTGIGGDAFALIWDGEHEQVHGLDAAGPAPRAADPTAPVEESGPRSVTVPGSVGGWAALSERFGRIGLDSCLSDAIDAARRGVAIAPITAAWWAANTWPAELGSPPVLGEVFRLADLGRTRRRSAAEGPGAFYTGKVAEAITAASWVEHEDLAAYQPRWVEPLTLDYREVTVCELPPPCQGVAALEGLGLLNLGEVRLPEMVECVRLALEDALAYVRDGADVSWLLEPTRLAKRRLHSALPTTEPGNDTVYVCAVDRDMAVSFIQSLFSAFGSGVVAPGTGVVLQNRGACFAVNGGVEPGRRPYHTIIPGMLLQDGRFLGTFGVVGGFMQAQAHVQLVSALVDDGLDPQAALDRPRFRVDGPSVRLEEGLWESAEEFERLGLEIIRSTDPWEFGAGQAILVHNEVLVGGSDGRKDGYAAGF
jgi:gamma-glutamyltranspeptidase/glutathione hydrolase